ncbi:MAG: zinc ribbon domain-containing protein [Anaerolineaceae bacterium]|nr:zinc ribbon domain-containing protein [Anaerolineaceae bacterium]
MPLYDYRCEDCDHEFVARHGFEEAPPPCPNCQSAALKRLIKRAPAQAKGVLTLAGDSSGATKEELRSKWAEETPKLRKKLVDKLGEDFVSRNAPTLNKSFED